MAKKKPLTKKQKRILQRRRRRRILFGIEIFILLILIGGVFIYAKLGKMNFTDLDFRKIGVNTGVSDNNVMKGYTTIGLIGLDGRDGKLKSGVRSDTMIIASINNDTKKVKLVLVLLLSIIKMSGGSQMNLMKAESPGPSVSRLAPTVRSTAKILYTIYLLMTVLETVILLLCGMPVFDALTTAFGTAGTGGFGIKNDSMGGYSVTIQIVVTVFMILFGINFNVYFLLLSKKWKQALKNEEVRWYLAIILGAVLLIGWNIRGVYGSMGKAIQQAAFQVASIITTTGFATVDFNIWPEVSRTILVLLMFVGACAGSTGGGIKVSRFIILLKAMKKEIKQYLHPRQIRKIRMDGRVVEHEVVRNVNVFMVVYIMIFATSVFILAFDNLDLITNFTAVAATFNNIGPGLELVGPTANFNVFSDVGKYVLIFDMLAGRLEIFPLLLVFFPDTWRKF